ncbi:glycosyltransferase family 4 protein [Haloarcula litorea]|uniref:glycosyltransferase family 4 protein n=1 Tax=Haloarcula litorea TaxID=3032579 RepID=UPI0023E78F41|nr:glycosyltransferase family 4 protein [Halomicroarcula sp. GDY20]
MTPDAPTGSRRVTVVAPRDPIPVNNGLTERVYQLATHLGRHHEVRLLHPYEPERAATAEGRVPDEQPFDRVALRSRAVGTLEWLLPDYSPLKGVYQFHPWLYPALRDHLTDRRPDAVVVEFPYLVPVVRAAARGLNATLVLSEHNVEYRFAERVGIPLWRLLAAFETSACRLVDAVVTVSDEDRRTLAARVDGANVEFLVAPNGVDVDRYAPAAAARAGDIADRYDLGAPTLVYHGNLANAHNSEAVRELLDEVFPAVRESHPDATLFLVGGNPPETDRPGVVTTGIVDDLPAHLAAADLAVAPIRSGSGTNLKILEYLATGLPVVTTPVGAEGFPLVDGTHARIVDGEESVAEATASLLGDDERRERFAREGRSLATDEFDWSETLRPYDRLLTDAPVPTARH